MTISERIKIIRNNLNLSQPKFGERIGVSRDVIANIELGRAEPKEMLIRHICSVFNINPLWLSDGKGEMFIETPESLIEDLAIEYKLTDIEKKIVSNFVKLPSAEREQVINLIKKLTT